tara:strand:- start:235 stop:1011 length:777 start_codon:yes stop_codon:yes gene_type:complete
VIDVEDVGRVRLLRLNRPEAKNAFNEAQYDSLTELLIEAENNSTVAVVVITGHGDSFSSGTDVVELGQRMANPAFTPGKHGFPGLADMLVDFSKPLLCAVNGIGLGIGVTILGLSDIVFMSHSARVKCPFTDLALAPEAASSFTFPAIMGRQNAAWTLLSSEWLSAEECFSMGLAFKLCNDEELIDVTMEHAQVLAAKPISSLVASKKLIMDPIRERIHAARKREDSAFAELLGKPANLEALQAFAEKRDPDFNSLGE